MDSSAGKAGFAYGGSLWVVGREGGDARRLVVGDPGTASGPLFSPDGTQVAFTGNCDTNQDVNVVPAAGGEPRRLTTHPGTDVAVGWSPDGRWIASFSDASGEYALHLRDQNGLGAVRKIDLGSPPPSSSTPSRTPGSRRSPMA